VAFEIAVVSLLVFACDRERATPIRSPENPPLVTTSPAAPARSTEPGPAAVPLAVTSAAAPVPSSAASDPDEHPAAEPENPPETLNQVSGKLTYADGTPAALVPFALESTCQVVYGVSDRGGSFSVKHLALPARFRAVDEFALSFADGTGFSRDGLLVKLEQRTPQAVLSPSVIQSSKVVAVVFTAQNLDAEALKVVDILSAGPRPGSVLGTMTPAGVSGLRREGYKVSVVSGDTNRFAVDTAGKGAAEMRALLEERVATAQKKLADARKGTVRRRDLAECAKALP
jgi:hypothetical protein